MQASLAFQAKKLKEKGTTNAFVDAIKRLSSENDIELALAIMLGSMADIKCCFCHGVGHISSECASKKNVDTAVKRVPGMRILWGTLKGNKVSTGKRTSAMLAGDTKVTQEVEVAKRAKSEMKGAAAVELM